MGAKKTIVPVVALALGAVLGWCMRPAPAVPEADAPAAHHSKSARKVKSNDEAALERLRSRVQDLEKKLAVAEAARKSAEDAASIAATNHPSAFGQRRNWPPRPPSPEELEKMRTENPEQYTQVTNMIGRFERMHEQRMARAANRMELLSTADTSRMTKKQLKTHNRLQELMARREELMEMMRPDNFINSTEEQRTAGFAEMREIGRELHGLQREERDTLLTQTANDLGYTGKDAVEVVEAIKSIYEATSGDHGFGPHGGRGGRHGGRGPRQ